MNKKYDYAIVIGRFQPFHSAHQKLIQYSLNLAEKVIVILGSARSAPDVKNPFTPAMREEIIRACFPKNSDKLIFRAIRDYPYNDHVWTTEVQNTVNESVEKDEAKIAVIGFFKDRSSYYLNLFPQWHFEEFYVADRSLLQINATQVREKFFSGDESWREFVPPQVSAALGIFSETEVFENLNKEFNYLQKYKADTQFVGVPFEPTFITTDAVVVQSGHVLVIRRGHQPGKGLLALPGGFLATGLTLEDNTVKELKEETGIKIPAQVLRGSIKIRMFLITRSGVNADAQLHSLISSNSNRVLKKVCPK